MQNAEVPVCVSACVVSLLSFCSLQGWWRPVGRVSAAAVAATAVGGVLNVGGAPADAAVLLDQPLRAEMRFSYVGLGLCSVPTGVAVVVGSVRVRSSTTFC